MMPITTDLSSYVMSNISGIKISTLVVEKCCCQWRNVIEGTMRKMRTVADDDSHVIGWQPLI